MTKAKGPLFTAHARFDLAGRAVELFLTRLLARRSEQHVADGLPPVAIFAFDYIGREIAVRGQFEGDELNVLADFLKPLSTRFASTVALDVGANIGNHSLFFAQRFGKVHAFEPNPRTFGLLKVNASLTDNIVVHNIGLGSKRGRASLNFNPLNVGEASLTPVQKGPMDVEIQIERLDDLSNQLGNVAFIKLDVEGFEPEVLAGAKAFLERFRPVVAFEQNPSAFVDGRSAAAELLVSMGYQLCILSRSEAGTGLLGRLVTRLRRLGQGVRYDVIAVETLAPGHYPMVIALNEEDFETLQGATVTIHTPISAHGAAER